MLINITSFTTVPDFIFRHTLPNISFPRVLTDVILAPYGYAVLNPTTPPAYDSWTHRLIEGTPEQRDGAWYQTWTLEPVVHTPEEEQAQLAIEKENKRQDILSGANNAALSIKSRYSTLEVDSWPVQQEQAESVLAGGTLPENALLTVLANANGVSVADFAARVMTNVAAAEVATKAVVSHQQALELLVKDAATVPEVMAIEVSYAS